LSRAGGHVWVRRLPLPLYVGSRRESSSLGESARDAPRVVRLCPAVSTDLM
jgi:hypothetical protein